MSEALWEKLAAQRSGFGMRKLRFLHVSDSCFFHEKASKNSFQMWRYLKRCIFGVLCVLGMDFFLSDVGTGTTGNWGTIQW